MDSGKLAKLAISHFKEKGHYSEIEIDKLESIFEKYLSNAYSKKVDLLSLQVDIDRRNDEEWSTEKYEQEMKELQTEMEVLVLELLANKKAEKVKIEY